MAATNTLERSVGEPHALAIYETDEGRRVLVAQRIDDIVRLVDRPLDPSGRRIDPDGRPYLVEASVGSTVELEAIVADYRDQAGRYGECPMRASAIALADSDRLWEAIS